DGIRDFHVTGVQTCALPIFGDADRARDGGGGRGDAANLRLLLDDDDLGRQELSAHDAPRLFFFAFPSGRMTSVSEIVGAFVATKIGRASCRESVASAAADTS